MSNFHLRHTPVLLPEAISCMPIWTKTILDWTLWHWWHTVALFQSQLSQGIVPTVVWVDRDAEMLIKANHFIWWEIPETHLTHILFHQWSYAQLDQFTLYSPLFDFMLLDIWVNMDHFKVGERWFSIKRDGELDMRFDRSSWEPCSAWLLKTHFNELNDIFERYTDFSESYRESIARSLLRTIKKTGIKTTWDMRVRAKDFWLSEKNLAVLFQSWRITINWELDELVLFLDTFQKYLSPGWRCAIMTYHSWEDRLVKYAFKELVDNWIGVHYNKKVIKPTWKEIQRNKASRSAKLRVFEKNGLESHTW